VEYTHIQSNETTIKNKMGISYRTSRNENVDI
jgi:hypothetical protein